MSNEFYLSNPLIHRDRRLGRRDTAWEQQFDCTHMRPLIICRGPIRKEAMDVFSEMGISHFGILLSEKDSIVYRNAIAPELRSLTHPDRVHRVPDYSGANKEEREQRIRQIINIARDNNYNAIFAGYGFMAEDEAMVAAMELAGLTFIGPCSRTVHDAGLKDEAKRTALKCGVSITPGIDNGTALTLLKKCPDVAALRTLVKKHALTAVDARLADNSISLEDKADMVLAAAYKSGIDLYTVDELCVTLTEAVARMATDYPQNRVRLKAMTRPPDLKELDEEVERLNKEKEEAVANQDFEKAAQLRDSADKLKKKKQNLTKDWREKSRETDGVVDEEVIAEVVSKMTGIPLTRMSTEDSKRLMEMEHDLHKRVISQDEAIKSISKAVRRSRSGLKDPKRPTGCFIFAGPTGVGKTLLAKALAEFMFGDSDALIQIDMSEYMEKHNVSRLIGAPPGYVGFEEGGQLTEKIRRRPYAVVLLDEIEKAHPDVYNMLLQIMEEGRLTDSFGRNVDFRNTIIIMTSNAGAGAIKNEAQFGFGSPDKDGNYDSMKSRVKDEIEKVFRPEFLGRVDDLIVFRHLSNEDLKQVVDLELSKVRDRLAERGLKLVLTDQAREFIVKKGSDLDFGARPLRRAIENFIEDPLSEELLKGEFKGKDMIRVEIKEVAGKKQLFFEGLNSQEGEPVGAGATGASDAS